MRQLTYPFRDASLPPVIDKTFQMLGDAFQEIKGQLGFSEWSFRPQDIRSGKLFLYIQYLARQNSALKQQLVDFTTAVEECLSLPQAGWREGKTWIFIPGLGRVGQEEKFRYFSPFTEVERKAKDPEREEENLTIIELAALLKPDIFKGRSLERCVLDGLIFHGIDFSDVEILDSSLSHVEMSECVLDRARVTRSHLKKSRILKSSIQCANFFNVTSEEANLTECTLDQTIFESGSYARVNFWGSSFNRASFVDVDITNASFQDCSVQALELRRVRLNGRSEYCAFYELAPYFYPAAHSPSFLLMYDAHQRTRNTMEAAAKDVKEETQRIGEKLQGQLQLHANMSRTRHEEWQSSRRVTRVIQAAGLGLLGLIAARLYGCGGDDPQAKSPTECICATSMTPSVLPPERADVPSNATRSRMQTPQCSSR